MMTDMTSPSPHPVTDDHKTRWIIRLLLIVILAGGFLLYETFKYDFIPKRFGTVDPGLVYRSGQISPRLIKQVLQDHNIKTIIESGGGDGMITMDNSLMARVKDGTIEPKEAFMKAANKALFASLLKPGELDGGH